LKTLQLFQQSPAAAGFGNRGGSAITITAALPTRRPAARSPAR
jgi:hypothetical protein